MGIVSSSETENININIQNKVPIPSRDSIGYKNLQEKLKKLREDMSDAEFVIVKNTVFNYDSNISDI